MTCGVGGMSLALQASLTGKACSHICCDTWAQKSSSNTVDSQIAAPATNAAWLRRCAIWNR